MLNTFKDNQRKNKPCIRVCVIWYLELV